VQPTQVVDGLAEYRRGDGRPVFVVPYPHASTTGPMAAGPLADICVGAGFEVLSFDPPGYGQSSRPPKTSIEEMVECTGQVLDDFHVDGPVPVLGHSMSALCAFVFAVRRPERVSKLVLIGTPPGGGWSIVRFRGMPFNWPPWRADFWRMLWWGLVLGAGRGSLAMHKRRDHLQDRASFVDQRFVPELEIEPGDEHRPPPRRDNWWHAIQRLRLLRLAGQLRAATLLMVGCRDPQTPMTVSMALHDRIPDSRLEVFPDSGHAPFIEERPRFARTLVAFLNETE
jgi:pimeloyl-ACP methyl ester carboxylesterase